MDEFRNAQLAAELGAVGVLLAILLRLGRTFELIANTQRELRRAIRHLAEHRGAEPGIAEPFGRWGDKFPPPPPVPPAHIEDDLGSPLAVK